MPTLILSDDEFTLLARSMDAHAWNQHQYAAGIVRDGGSNMRHAKAVRRLADKVEAGPAKPRTTTFTRGGYSFRPNVWASGTRFWEVLCKGERRGKMSGQSAALIVEATDGETWCVSVANLAYDARPSFAAACDLVMARLPRNEEA